MAGSLIKLDEQIVTGSAVATVTLGASNWDSSYDVYMVQLNNVTTVNDGPTLRVRFTVGGVQDSSANYDEANKMLRTDTAFTNEAVTNATDLSCFVGIGTGTGEQVNGNFYLFNFNNPSEYSFCTYENTMLDSLARNRGKQGGAVLTVAQSCDGLYFYLSDATNINTGSRFVLYGLKK